jgi:hypothetical protein
MVWTDTRSFPREAFFDIQDAVYQSMVAAAYPRLIATVHAGLAPRRRPEDAQAWELAHDALLHHDRREREANDEVQNQWGAPGPASDRLLRCDERCVELAPHQAEGHDLVARHFQTHGEHDRAVLALEKAVGENSSFAAEACGNDADGAVDEGCNAPAAEACNGVDDDRDGQVDEDAFCGALQRCLAGLCVAR